MRRCLSCAAVTLLIVVVMAGCGSSSPKSSTTTTTSASSAAGHTTTTKPASGKSTTPATKGQKLIGSLQIGLAAASKAIQGKDPAAAKKACAAALVGLRLAQSGAKPFTGKAATEWVTVLKRGAIAMTLCVQDSSGAKSTAYQNAKVRSQLRLAIYGTAVKLGQLRKTAK